MKVVLAQVNPLVGDIKGNTDKVIDIADSFGDQLPDVIIFPELNLLGYPPEDLLLRPSLEVLVSDSLTRLSGFSRDKDVYLVVGFPLLKQGKLFNACTVIYRGQRLADYCKQKLPNYQVFDEKRYFAAGDEAVVVDIRGIPTALSICEDIWHPEPMIRAKEAGARMMININASPFHAGKQEEREQLLTNRAKEGGMPVVYVNQVGGQDELVFDGGSCVVDASGRLVARAPAWEECLCEVTVSDDSDALFHPQKMVSRQSELESVYSALVCGVRDYVGKNGFRGVVLGLSGGIDSALTLAVAVDALGPDVVEAIMMPFEYTSSMSVEDAAEEAAILGVKYSEIPIAPIYQAFIDSLEEEFSGTDKDKTEENIQARSRGVLLMAISNKNGSLVLTTGNKSEMAVGYCTLYGDMVGGFAVLKDVPKTLVYQLAEYRNSRGRVIPQRVIDRPPSAELAPDQKDEDSLPPYNVLDQILEFYVEQDMSASAIVQRGFDRDDVYRVVKLVDINEYKRRQSPVGVRITQRGFGRDRRYPITNGWKIGD